MTETLAGTPFRKMNGLGNDFVVIDARGTPFAITPESARRITDRKRGVGCDQLIVLETSSRADVFMRIINADGSEVDACGNAARCIGRLIMDETHAPSATIETKADLLFASEGGSGFVSVDMGRPRFDWASIPLAGPAEIGRAHV